MNSNIQRLVGNFFANYFHLIAGTVRAHIFNLDHPRALIHSHTPIVFAGFHGQNRLVIAIMKYLEIPAEKPIGVVIAGDHRQEMLESLSRKLGYKTYAIGSSEHSLRGAREVLKAIIDLKSGQIACLFLAVDGPDGPAFEPKPGTAFIAQRAEASIVPMAIYSPQAIVLQHRWDQLAMPIPYSDVYVYFGESIATTSNLKIDEILSQISESLKMATKEVKTLAAQQSG